MLRDYWAVFADNAYLLSSSGRAGIIRRQAERLHEEWACQIAKISMKITRT